MYFTDRGIEELADRRGEEQVTVAWLAERLRDFVDLTRTSRPPCLPGDLAAHRAAGEGHPLMYFTDRGIEELADRRGEEQVTVAWLAERLRNFVDLNPDFETAVDRLATWLARLDDDEEDPF